MILERIFSKYYSYLTIRFFRKRYRQNTAQRVLVNYLLGRETIYSDEGEIIYKNIIEVKLNRYARNEISINKDIFLRELEKEKHFLIDLSLFNVHSRRGKSSLKTQVLCSLSIIREFLFDENLILVGSLDYSFLGRNRVKIYSDIQEFPLEKYKPIILDPEGDIIFSEDLLKKYNLFLIGGIVDVGLEWKGGTSYLFRDLDLPRARIELEGTIRGVPDRINLIIKILLESYYLNIPLRDAIVRNQGKRDVLNRLWYEIKRYSKKKLIRREDLRNIIKNINISEEDLIKFLEKNGFKLV